MPRAPKSKVKDPVQQKLREHKRSWSNNTSDLISKIISFKRALNGRGDAEYNLPPSNIKDQLPSQVGSFLEQLSSEFQKVVSEAHSIIEEQSRYSQSRKKQNPSQPNIDKVLSNIAALSDGKIEKVASNKLSRFWQYFKSIFSRDGGEKFRISLLNLSSKIYYDLLDFENLILGDDTISDAIIKYQSIIYNFKILTRSLREIAQLKNKEETDDKKEGTEIEKIKENIEKIYNLGLNGKDIIPLSKLIEKYENEEDHNVKKHLKYEVLNQYSNLIKSILSNFKKENPEENINTIEDVFKLSQASQIDGLVKLAHNRFTRYLKKKWEKLFATDKTAGIRLKIAEILEGTVQDIQNIMNNLEQGLDPNQLFPLIKEVEKDWDEINKLLNILNLAQSEKFLNQPNKKDNYLEFLARRNIRKDIQKELF